MKAKMEASCEESRRAQPVLLDGGIHKKTNKKNKSGAGMEENAEMKEYLGKLQELVPFMPKNKRLSKLEVISNVIDYIHDLRETLGLPPCQNMDIDFDDHVTNPSTCQVTATSNSSHLLEATNQTFKVSILPASESIVTPSSETTESSRLPLATICTPRSTENI